MKQRGGVMCTTAKAPHTCLTWTMWRTCTQWMQLTKATSPTLSTTVWVSSQHTEFTGGNLVKRSLSVGRTWLWIWLCSNNCYKTWLFSAVVLPIITWCFLNETLSIIRNNVIKQKIEVSASIYLQSFSCVWEYVDESYWRKYLVVHIFTTYFPQCMEFFNVNADSET